MKQPFIREMVRDSVAGFVNHPGGGGAAGLIAGLFAQGQQGFWLPFTDFASLSQDSAGTLPYTALEQPVGRVLDRSGRGNHATQATSTARGVVSARVNLLQGTEDYLYAGWLKTGGALLEAGGVGHTPAVQALKITLAPGQTVYQAAVAAAKGYAAKVFIKTIAGAGVISVNSPNGVSYLGGGATAPLADWTEIGGLPQFDGNTNGIRFNNLGAETVVMLVSAPSFTLASQASRPYQRVNTSSDYDAIGFPKSLRVEVDDFYTCGGGGSTTGFYYSDVVRLNSSNNPTLFSNILPNQGYVALITNGTNKPKLYAGNGTAFTQMDSIDALVVGVPSCVQMWDDGVNLNIQINNGAIASAPRPAVLAGPSTMSLYYGGGGAYFNGQITEPIYRAGPPPSAYERSVIRGYQMQKAGL